MPDQTFSEELYDDAALKEAVDRMANLIKTHATKTYVDEVVEQKQDKLTFDDVSTENSENMVNSGVVYGVEKATVDIAKTNFGTINIGTLVADKYVRLSDGRIGTSSVTGSISATQYIPISGGAILFSCPMTSSASALAGIASIAFYSSNNVESFISAEPFISGAYGSVKWIVIPIPYGAKYFRASIYNDVISQYEAICVLSITEELSNKQDTLDPIKVGHSTIGAMVDIAETYLNQAYSSNNQIVYETRHGIYSDPLNEQGKKAIVCSQFMKALLTGTPYEFSRYVQNTNEQSWWGYEYDSSTDAEFAEGTYGYLWSDQVAKYCDDKNLLVPFDVNHINVRPGDIMFWSDNNQSDRYLNIVHCAVCLYLHPAGCYVIHAAKNIARPVDGEDAGIEVSRMAWSSNPPSYYARLPLIAGEHRYQEIYKSTETYTGTYSGSSASIKNIDISLPIGFYSLHWEDNGDGVGYIKLNPNGINVNIDPFKQGNKYCAVFYATEPVARINLRSTNGTSFNVSNVILYKGYKMM